MAKDFFKNPINIGNTVAFMQTKYRNLMVGTVVGITEKTVLIEHEKLANKNVKSKTRQDHGQVIVKNQKELDNDPNRSIGKEKYNVKV